MGARRGEGQQPRRPRTDPDTTAGNATWHTGPGHRRLRRDGQGHLGLLPTARKHRDEDEGHPPEARGASHESPCEERRRFGSVR
jgi:hypothetical protein